MAPTEPSRGGRRGHAGPWPPRLSLQVAQETRVAGLCCSAAAPRPAEPPGAEPLSSAPWVAQPGSWGVRRRGRGQAPDNRTSCAVPPAPSPTHGAGWPDTGSPQRWPVPPPPPPAPEGREPGGQAARDTQAQPDVQGGSPSSRPRPALQLLPRPSILPRKGRVHPQTEGCLEWGTQGPSPHLLPPPGLLAPEIRTPQRPRPGRTGTCPAPPPPGLERGKEA